MKKCLVVLWCIAVAAMLAYGQGADEGYQPARVVSFENQALDARHPETSGGYKISMRMGNTIYLCRASGPASVFVDWSVGKEFPAKLEGKVLLVKGSNGQAELNITGKKTAK